MQPHAENHAVCDPEKLGFRPIAGIVAPDQRGRITIGQVLRVLKSFLGRKAVSFRAYVNEGGQVLLDPVVDIPLREQWLFEDPRAMKALREGLRSATEKPLVNLGSFKKYADDDA